MSSLSIILKVVDYCNFRCDFCRYTLQANTSPKKMNIDLAKMCVHKAAMHNISQGKNFLHIIFHGGEPLLWEKKNYEKIFEFEKYLKKEFPDFFFFNSIQTNASLLDQDIAMLFLENDVDIGISIDGPEKINFHKNADTGVDIFSKINMLNDLKCNYGILSVITNSHKGCAKEYYEFIKANKIKSVGLCYCFDPIGNFSIDNEILSDFLIELFDLYFFGTYKFRIREFDGVITKCLGHQTHNCNFRCREACGNYFSIFPNGEVHFCDAYEYKGYSLGNIIKSDFSQILASDTLNTILSSLVKNYNNNCKSCPILNLCGGGCFRNDMQNGKNYFCKSYLKTYTHIEKIVNQYKKDKV